MLPLQNPGFPPCGLNGQGTVKELTDEENLSSIEDAYYTKFRRQDRKEVAVQIRSSKPTDRALYEISINRFVIYDKFNSPDQARQELKV